jgi:hypothetical protein
LYPFSAAEINNTDINFVENLFNDNLSYKNYKKANLINIINKATFPELALNKHLDG